MGEQGIPLEIRTFIVDQIDSVVQLEILLLLHGNPQRGYSSADIGRELRIDPSWAQDQLAELTARGMAAPAASENVPVYRYAPKNSQMDNAIDGLAHEYSQRRVSVVTLIFSKPVDKLRTFADAFRFRKDRSDG